MKTTTARNLLDELAPVFRPHSHAVIGASSNGRKSGGRYLQALLYFGHVGRPYPVNPQPTVIALPLEAVREDDTGAEGDRRRTRDFFPEHSLPVCLAREGAARALTEFTGYHRRRVAASTA